MNYYQFHIGDFALHTSHLSVEEECVYRRLLDYYYDTESPIPKKTDKVIRRLRLSGHEALVGVILDEFFVMQDDGWHNLRADIEIAEYNRKALMARENGKKGGRPKKNSGLETPLVNSANQEETVSKANQEPITNNQEPLTSNQVKPTSPPKAPPCKTQEIISLFTMRCPSMIQPRVVTDAVKGMIADRWRQDPEHQSLEFWERFFDYCESLDFLTGRCPPTRGDKPFRVGLDWVVKSANFAKIINGNYTNG